MTFVSLYRNWPIFYWKWHSMQWRKNIVVPRHYSATSLQCHGITVPRHYSATALQCHIITVPQHYIAMALQCHSITVPRHYSATALQCHLLTMVMTWPISNAEYGATALSITIKTWHSTFWPIMLSGVTHSVDIFLIFAECCHAEFLRCLWVTLLISA